MTPPDTAISAEAAIKILDGLFYSQTPQGSESWAARIGKDEVDAVRGALTALRQGPVSGEWPERDKDLAWLERQKQVGHCGESTSEAIQRGRVNACIDRLRDALLTAIQTGTGVEEEGDLSARSLPDRVEGDTPKPLSDGPSDLDRAWRAVDVLGAPDTACTTAEDRAYCRAIGDALAEIEKLGGRWN